MKQSVYSALALPAEGFQPVMSYEGVINYATFNAGGVLQNLIDIGKERMAGDREIFLGQLVKGTGTGAAEMKGILKRAVPDGTHDPLVFIGQRSKTCAIGMLNWAIAADCKRFAEGNGNETQFAKDLVRDHDIMLPNGKKLSQDFATACDEIAQLVTRDPTATYAKLDAKAKGKAHVVMSLLTQESLKAMTDGNALALDPKMNKPAFTTVSSQNDDKRVFHINVSSDGYFEMEITSTSNLKALMVLNDDGQYDMVTTDPAKNEMRHTLSLQIKPNEFDRLAQVDFTKFDAVAAKNAFDSKDEDTDKIGRTVNTFAPECKLNVDGVICDTAVYSSFN